MSDPTPPAVSEAMREAVARDVAMWTDMVPGRRPCRLDEWLSRPAGPIASEIARLTGERDAAIEMEAKLLSTGMQMTALISAAEQDARWYREQHAAAEAALSRLQADREAEVAKLKTACDHYEKALSHLWDGGSVLATDELAAARKARAALTETPDA